MSGPGRKMYRSLEPKTEGVILAKRSKPQGANTSPHDLTTSLIDWRRLEHTRRNDREDENPNGPQRDSARGCGESEGKRSDEPLPTRGASVSCGFVIRLKPHASGM